MKQTGVLPCVVVRLAETSAQRQILSVLSFPERLRWVFAAHAVSCCCIREKYVLFFTGSLLTSNKLGVCSPYPPLDVITVSSNNQGCRNDCTDDKNCAGALKCCQYGCSSVCTAPRNATSEDRRELKALQQYFFLDCLHYQASIDEVNAELSAKNTTSSLTSRHFRPNCDPRTGNTRFDFYK